MLMNQANRIMVDYFVSLKSQKLMNERDKMDKKAINTSFFDNISGWTQLASNENSFARI